MMLEIVYMYLSVNWLKNWLKKVYKTGRKEHVNGKLTACKIFLLRVECNTLLRVHSLIQNWSDKPII